MQEAKIKVLTKDFYGTRENPGVADMLNELQYGYLFQPHMAGWVLLLITEVPQ